MKITAHPPYNTDSTRPVPWKMLTGRVLLIALLGLGVFFRLAGLGVKIYSHDEALASLRSAGYSGDEVFAHLLDGEDHQAQEISFFLIPDSSKTPWDTIRLTILSGANQVPLFYVLEHFWMRLAGSSAAATRLLAAILGILAIPAMYWFSRELFENQPVALFSTALFAISPFHILFSQDARPYSLWTLATLLSSAALLRAQRINSRAAWLVYAACLILGVYAHQLFLLVALVHGLYFGITSLLPARKPVPGQIITCPSDVSSGASQESWFLVVLRRARDFSGFFLAAALALLAYLPWLAVLVTSWDTAASKMQWVEMQVSWRNYIQRWALIFSSPLIDLEFGPLNIAAYLLRAPVLVLIAISFLYLALRGTAKVKTFLLLLALVPALALILPDLLLGGIRSISGRYLTPTNIAIVMALGWFLAIRLEQSRPGVEIRSVLLLSALLGASLFSNLNSLLAPIWWNKELGKVTPAFVEAVNQDGTLLVVTGAGRGTTLGDLLALSMEIDRDVHFRLPPDPLHIGDIRAYTRAVLMSPGLEQVEKITQANNFRAREVVPWSLWQITPP